MSVNSEQTVPDHRKKLSSAMDPLVPPGLNGVNGPAVPRSVDPDSVQGHVPVSDRMEERVETVKERVWRQPSARELTAVVGPNGVIGPCVTRNVVEDRVLEPEPVCVMESEPMRLVTVTAMTERRENVTRSPVLPNARGLNGVPGVTARLSSLARSESSLVVDSALERLVVTVSDQQKSPNNAEDRILALNSLLANFPFIIGFCVSNSQSFTKCLISSVPCANCSPLPLLSFVSSPCLSDTDSIP